MLLELFRVPTMSPSEEQDFQLGFRRRSYDLALFVLIIGACAGTTLQLLSVAGYGSPIPFGSRPLWETLALTWAPPLLVYSLRSASPSRYPWIVSAAVLFSAGLVLAAALRHGLLSNPHHLSTDELLQLQIWVVSLVFWVTALVQLPFRFAVALACGCFAAFFLIYLLGGDKSTPIAVVRVGTLVFLGLVVAASIDRRERRLFLAKRESDTRLHQYEAAKMESDIRLRQYEDAQDAAIQQITALETHARETARRRAAFIREAFHDLRNPFTAVALALDNYETALNNNFQDLAAHAFQNLRDACYSGHKLARDLFDLSTFEDPRNSPRSLTPVNVTQLLLDIAAVSVPRAQLKGIALRVHRSRKGTLFGMSDEAALRRVLSNLVANAIKFTPPPETAQKGMCRRRPPASGVVIGALRFGDHIQLQVRDTGIGIPKDRRAMIWEYGHTSRGTNSEEGTGIGLTLVRAICESLAEHDLRFTSRTESAGGRSGSLFSVTIPACAPVPKEAAGELSVLPADNLSGMHVLLVDNDRVTRTGELHMLRLLASSPLEADGVTEAVRVSQLLGKKPDLIVTDFHLSNMETGAQVISAIRERWNSTIPAIVATADLSSVPLEATRSLQSIVVLHKPLTRSELLSAVRRFAAERAQATDPVRGAD